MLNTIYNKKVENFTQKHHVITYFCVLICMPILLVLAISLITTIFAIVIAFMTGII